MQQLPQLAEVRAVRRYLALGEPVAGRSSVQVLRQLLRSRLYIISFIKGRDDDRKPSGTAWLKHRWFLREKIDKTKLRVSLLISKLTAPFCKKWLRTEPSIKSTDYRSGVNQRNATISLFDRWLSNSEISNRYDPRQKDFVVLPRRLGGRAIEILPIFR